MTRRRKLALAASGAVVTATAAAVVLVPTLASAAPTNPAQCANATHVGQTPLYTGIPNKAYAQVGWVDEFTSASGRCHGYTWAVAHVNGPSPYAVTGDAGVALNVLDGATGDTAFKLNTTTGADGTLRLASGVQTSPMVRSGSKTVVLKAAGGTTFTRFGYHDLDVVWSPKA